MRPPALALAVAVLFGAAFAAPAGAQPALVLWAWERPEDLRSAGPDVEVAAVVGFVELTGAGLWARGRRFALRTAPGARRTAVVHVQIDPGQLLVWTPALRARAAQTVLAYARTPGFQAVQIDFEVKESQRQVLLDLLHDVRAGLPATTPLSMNALASWCETETWVDAAEVDEIVPMVFRMGPEGERLKARLAAGEDFADPRCRTAIGVSTDTPLARIPAGRRVYVFNPHSWTPADIAAVLRNHP
ncbi:hypothetical protein [Phenylobacterium sp.]|uniref:hypothetical protein n=1 Tax=Phenylobacterium sp. TaxID=1871053 RepID=UPI002F4160A5